MHGKNPGGRSHRDFEPSPSSNLALNTGPMMMQRPPVRHTFASLCLVGLFAVAGSLYSGSARVDAQPLAGFNSNAPVQYAADRIELQDRQKQVVLSGSVDISQGDLKMRAERTVVSYVNNGTVKIQRIDASGGVIVSRGNETGRGDVAIYDFNTRIITMVGNVALSRGPDTLNGGRLVINLASGLASVTGNGGSSKAAGRVSGTFTVPRHN